MPRTAQPDSRERILRAATRLFYAEGTATVGMARIVDEAGCGKNLVYTHFPSKDALVRAYLEDFAGRREATFTAVTAPLDDPRARLLALTHEIGERSGRPDFRGCALRNYLAEGGGPEVGSVRVARGFLRRSRTRIRRLVEASGVEQPREVADQIWLVHEGLYSPAVRTGTRRTDVTAAAVRLVERLLA